MEDLFDTEPKGIRLIVFNLNDVLVNTSLVLEACLRNALLDFFPNISFDHHYYLDKNYRVPVSIKLMKLKRELKFPMAILEKIEWTYEEYAKEAIQYMTLDDHVIECLDGIQSHEVRLVVVSNTRKNLFKAVIDATGLDGFIDYYKSAKESDIPHIMPDPSIIKYMSRRFRVARRNTLVVDNSDLGHHMANEADTHYLGVPMDMTVNIDMFKNWRLV